MRQRQNNLATRVIEFCRYARDRGLSAAVKESVDALEAVRAAGVADRDSFKVVLRAVLCSSKEEWDLFDDIFESFWSVNEAAAQRRAGGGTTRQRAGLAQKSTASPLLGPASSSGAEDHAAKSVVGATAHERLKRADFSEIPQHDVHDLEKLSLRLLRHMSLRLSRRLTTLAPTGQVDLRRTIRRTISRGGEPIELSFKGRKRQRSRLVILLDVSGSMNAYSIFLLKFAFILQKHFRQVNTFLFSTRLEEITAMLRKRELSDALQLMSQQTAGWSGGTRIGESLHEFNLLHARRVLSRDALVIILSDGWDTGEPEVLAGQLAAIKRRSRKVIWLNPLLGMSDYQPVTRGMSAALPWIDVFAPAHNLESLLELEKHLACPAQVDPRSHR